MKHFIFVALSILLTQPGTVFAQQEAHPIASKSLEMMGGVEFFDTLDFLHLEKITHQFLIEQSESPDGEPLVNYLLEKEYWNFVHPWLRKSTSMMGIFTNSSEWSPPRTVIATPDYSAMTRQEKVFPFRYADVQAMQLNRILLPHIALQTVLGDPAATAETVDYQNIPHSRLTADSPVGTLHVYINRNTSLVTAIETIVSLREDLFWHARGDVTIRRDYSMWSLQPGMIRFPFKWDDFRNEYKLSESTIIAVSFETQEEFPDVDQVLSQADMLTKAMPATTLDKWKIRETEELAPGIIQYRGNWNVAAIQQEDGIVILEAPITSWYSEHVLETVKSAFPGKPIKAVVTTSDAWPHFGGIRQYVAEGIPVYCLEMNAEAIQHVLAVDHVLQPDSLAQTDVSPNLTAIADNTTIGSGANRFELIPIRGEGGERMMMAWFPEHKLLYGSDLVQPNLFFPQYVSEIIDAVERENLTPESIFNFHTGLMDWTAMLEEFSTKLALDGAQ